MLRTWALCGILFILTLAGSAAAEETQPSTGVKWQNDLRAAYRVAVREEKPLLLVFGAEWCGWCKRLENTTLANPELSAYINEHFVAVHLDVDIGQGERVSEILEVDSLPCTVILTTDAEQIDRFLGYADVPEFQRKLSAAIERHAELTQTTNLEIR